MTDNATRGRDARRWESRREFLAGALVVAGGGLWLFGGRRLAGAAAARPDDAVKAVRSEPWLTVTLAEFSPAGARTGVVTVDKVMKTDAQWRRQLSRLEHDVLRKFDDEMAFSGAFWKNHEPGIYLCAACDTAVFGSAHKYDSGTGWPSFTQPLARENISLVKANGLVRITCPRCDSFLGDLFDDGPPPAGLRYCINSVALRFVPANALRSATAVVAGGCFWGVDAVFKHLRGVTSATSGYAGGSAGTANYEAVSDGASGHAESVRVTFDPAVVSYEALLKVFFLVAHDPTQLNRQGPDVGLQYRSAVFFADDTQKRAAVAAIAELGRSEAFDRRIVTQVVPLDRFYMAEPYHQNYVALHPNEPYVRFNDLPKLERLKAEFPERFRESSASG